MSESSRMRYSHRSEDLKGLITVSLIYSGFRQIQKMWSFLKLEEMEMAVGRD